MATFFKLPGLAVGMVKEFNLSYAKANWNVAARGLQARFGDDFLFSDRNALREAVASSSVNPIQAALISGIAGFYVLDTHDQPLPENIPLNPFVSYQSWVDDFNSAVSGLQVSSFDASLYLPTGEWSVGALVGSGTASVHLLIVGSEVSGGLVAQAYEILNNEQIAACIEANSHTFLHIHQAGLPYFNADGEHLPAYTFKNQPSIDELIDRSFRLARNDDSRLNELELMSPYR